MNAHQRVVMYDTECSGNESLAGILDVDHVCNVWHRSRWKFSTGVKIFHLNTA